MSRAFVKEDDGDPGAEAPPELVVSALPNYVTAEGEAALTRRVETLRAERDKALGLDDEEARRHELAHIDRDLRYAVHRMESAILVDNSNMPADEVHFGSRVTVSDQDDRETTYRIVGEDEADLAKGLLSWASPLARSLVKAKAGDTVTWKRPAGDAELEIVAVDNGKGVARKKSATSSGKRKKDH